MKIRIIHIVMMLMALPAIAQERHIMSGRVVAETYYLKNILVVNVQAGKETRTDSLGNFSLLAKTGDILHITDASIESRQVEVGKDFSAGETIIVNTNEAYELEAVVVETTGITSESLGLVKENQKRYTPGERKLYTAGDFKPIHLLAIIGGGMPLDPIFNAINGRTKMLKKAINAERKEAALGSLDGMFTDTEIIEQFQIPQDYIKGFLYYCVEDKDYVAAVASNNETMVRFTMGALAIKYLEILKEEPVISDDK